MVYPNVEPVALFTVGAYVLHGLLIADIFAQCQRH